MAITNDTLNEIRALLTDPDQITKGLELLDHHAAETIEIDKTVRAELDETKESLKTARAVNMAEYLAKATGSADPKPAEEDKPKTWEDMTPEEAQAEFIKRVKGGE